MYVPTRSYLCAVTIYVCCPYLCAGVCAYISLSYLYLYAGPQKIWDSLETLEHAASLETNATILGKIDRAMAEKVLAWELGELYAVGYLGEVVFCIPGGTVVVG